MKLVLTLLVEHLKIISLILTDIKKQE